MAGRPVVWLHGWGMSPAIWQAVPEFACFDSHALSLPGHGGEPWAEALGESLSEYGIAWYISSVQFEEDTGFWHTEWVWEVA